MPDSRPGDERAGEISLAPRDRRRRAGSGAERRGAAAAEGAYRVVSNDSRHNVMVQLANDSLTTVVPPTFTTSCPLHVPFALALPVNVALTASPVLVLPVQLTVPDADRPSALALRSAVQSGPLESVTPTSLSDEVIAASTELANAVSRDFSIWPDALIVGLIRLRVELAAVLGGCAGAEAGGVGEVEFVDELDGATEAVELFAGLVGPPA